MEPGTVIAGKFRVERALGKGGMGTVVVARHLELDQLVALKFLNAELAGQPAIAERFLREARSSAKLRSEYACRVMDVARLPTGEPYIVMELLEGEDLGRMVAKHPFGVTPAADYVIQACVAIAEAHAAGIVHRDLKPSNLFLTKRVDGSAVVKVLDFGIATAPGGESKITQTASVIGSPAYMSPEQLRSAKDVDARSDIWSLGVILYELVSGRLPFPGDSITEVAVKVTIDPPIPLGVQPAYDAVVLRAIEKDLAKRYQSVAELAHALAPFASPAVAPLAGVIEKLVGGMRVSQVDAIAMPAAPAPALAFQATQAATRSPMPTTLAGSASSREIAVDPPKRRTGLIAGAIAVVAVGAGAGWLALHDRGEPAAKPAPIDAGVVAAVAPADATSPPPVDAEVIVAVAPVPAVPPKRPIPPTPRPPTPTPTPSPIPTPTPGSGSSVGEGSAEHKYSLDEVKQMMAEARAALDKNPLEAVRLADEVLADRGSNAEALVVATIGQCLLHHPTIAKRHWAKLGIKQGDHAPVKQRCADAGIDLDAPVKHPKQK